MTAPAIAGSVDVAAAAPALTPEQELYRIEKAKRAERISPAMQEAAAELKRQQEAAVLARKGGRPKGADLKLGRNRLPRSRLLDVGDDAPGRPDRLHLDRPDRPRAAAAAPLLPQPPRAESLMAKTFAPRHCLTCSTEFTPRGPTHRYCTDPCNPNNAGASTPPPQDECEEGGEEREGGEKAEAHRDGIPSSGRRGQRQESVRRHDRDDARGGRHA